MIPVGLGRVPSRRGTAMSLFERSTGGISVKRRELPTRYMYMNMYVYIAGAWSGTVFHCIIMHDHVIENMSLEN